EFVARRSIQVSTYLALVSLVLSIGAAHWPYVFGLSTISSHPLAIIGLLIIAITLASPLLVSVDASASKLFLLKGKDVQRCSLCCLAAGLRGVILEVEEKGRRPYECGNLEATGDARCVGFNCARPLHNGVYKLEGTSLILSLIIMLLKNKQLALLLHIYVRQPLYRAMWVTLKGCYTDLKLRLRRRRLPERGCLTTFEQELREDITLEIGSLLGKIDKYLKCRGITLTPAF
ncbi:MAG: hypothetical protein DRJ67_10390, partial [Thermoprotei archaeon]